ncbi:MetQ/NlpA family ABC transporter substrate-binding protein [Paeniglutamicibacter kerguelensis]|uniref:D-methionine transport system substrate-binding protein n=1 Tax=Paeniglutamicibacter kerguelensis TaxID=254788 RepID=A0ABS4XJR6_9MICC|nr:MetQ/NlpA family ABC transporter substrate-binding protein [Paeniglutamicibacter kerguelensis]MBP2388708.1 D-methionine transport system substrate-binding protein [Paeniglutamicibacter kerguelensis]
MERRTFIRGSLGLGTLAGLAALTGCGLTGQATASGNDKTIKLIVTESAPYQEPTKLAQKALEADGWKVEVKYVTDIVQPNFAVANGEFDANYFQHASYLAQFTKDKNLAVEPAFYMYGSPGGIYSQKHKSIDGLPTGAKIAIPVDPSNNGRALAMLAKAGVIKVAEGKSVIHLSQNDILENPKKVTFVEVDQQSLSKTLPDVDAGFLFVRLGAELGLTPEDALLFEDNADALPFICLVAAKPGFAETEKGKALEKAYHSDEVRNWFKNYIGGVLPTPWDRDPAADRKVWDS